MNAPGASARPEAAASSSPSSGRQLHRLDPSAAPRWAARPAGTPVDCDAPNPCTVGSTCSKGVCGEGSPKDCTSQSGPCAVGLRNESSGACEAVADPSQDREACDDGQPCTVGATCDAGACHGGGPKACSSTDDECVVGVCNPTGGASDAAADGSQDGEPCDDGQPCTVDTACSDGLSKARCTQSRSPSASLCCGRQSRRRLCAGLLG